MPLTKLLRVVTLFYITSSPWAWRAAAETLNLVNEGADSDEVRRANEICSEELRTDWSTNHCKEGFFSDCICDGSDVLLDAFACCMGGELDVSWLEDEGVKCGVSRDGDPDAGPIATGFCDQIITIPPGLIASSTTASPTMSTATSDNESTTTSSGTVQETASQDSNTEAHENPQDSAYLIGLGVGLGVGVPLLLGIAGYLGLQFWRTRRRAKQDPSESSDQEDLYKNEWAGRPGFVDKAELPASTSPRYELGSTSPRHELGEECTQIHEMPVPVCELPGSTAWEKKAPSPIQSKQGNFL